MKIDWDRLSHILTAQADFEHEVAEVYAMSSEIEQQRILSEIKYNLGGDACERIVRLSHEI